ncbi:XRE family transcriptional regulator [Actinocorallia longicatena]|uniref:XRE family transcriptional regulator n=1 Tax=Actinocorallia longicatena TaxID=111803 RepID=A0ABP6QEM9_9ACTN
MESVVEEGFAERIGQRVRRLRNERGLSLSELAHRAGVGKATLSGVEAGTRNATLETLYAIAAQLEVHLAAIVAEPGGPAEPVDIVAGDAVSGTLLETFEDPGWITELYRLRIRPGRVQFSPAHPTGVTEHLTVFSGTARVGPEGAPVTVPPGGHAVWAADVRHIYAAETEEEVQASLVIRYPRPDPPTGPAGPSDV